jgi:hypothetical protein
MRSERWTTIYLWLVAATLATLGLFPASNWFGEVTVPWWRAAVLPWLIWSSGVLAVAVAAASLGPRCDAAIERLRASILGPSPRRFAATVFVVAAALSATMAWFMFRARLVSGDEMSLRFQAALFLHGRLFAVPEQYLEFFNSVEALDANGRWFSQFPVGGAALLSLGAAVGLPWLVNPLLVGWTVVSFLRFARAVSTESFARWATLLFALCPYLLYLAGSQLNHTPGLAFIMWGIANAAVWATSANPGAIRRAGALTGFAFGCAATIRPYDAALCAVAVGALQLTIAARDPVHARRRALAWQLAAGLLPIALLLLANNLTTGSPLLFAYDALNGTQHRPGFHIDPRGLTHTPERAMYLAASYLMRLNVSLFESPIPALAFVILGLVLGRGVRRWDAMWASIVVLLVAGYALYWHEGFYVLGPRFMYCALPALVWLAARGAAGLPDFVRPPIARRAAVLILPIAIAMAWILPPNQLRLFGVTKTALFHHLVHSKPKPNPLADARAAGLDNALVFVPDSWHASLASRLRALGTPPLAAEALVPRVDACGLQLALDALPPGAAGPNALGAVLGYAQSLGAAAPVNSIGDQGRRISLVPGRPLEPECAAHLAAESRPAISLATLLPFAEFDDDGRLGGPVVWARDLGPRDTLLKARFGNRRWYRYVPDAAEPRARFVAW